MENETPKPGHIFVVSEVTNLDGHGSWRRSFTSRQAAQKYYWEISELANNFGGLYPNKGVREVTLAKAQEWAEAERKAWEWEQADFEAWEKERAEYEADRDHREARYGAL
jgi:hypothetical protein